MASRALRILSRRVPVASALCTTSRALLRPKAVSSVANISYSYPRLVSTSKTRPFFSSTTGENSPASANVDNSIFAPLDTFQRRHVGPSSDEVSTMLSRLQYDSLDAFVKDVIPSNILSSRNLKVEPEGGMTETQLLQRLKEIASKNNHKMRSFIGCGYAGTFTPGVIQRNILESPEWYTSYTPYQPEISQGRSFVFRYWFHVDLLTSSRSPELPSQLPDSCHRSYRNGNRQCFRSRRGNRRV